MLVSHSPFFFIKKIIKRYQDLLQNKGGKSSSGGGSSSGSSKRPADSSDEPVAKRAREAPSSWLQRSLRVRIVSDSYKKGKYYLKKVVIEDVITPELCTCLTDDGKHLEGTWKRKKKKKKKKKKE